MIANFWKYTKEHNSTAHPTTEPGKSFDIQLKAPTDILNPSIILSDANTDISMNYCYIPSFKRYYRVNNWTYVAGMWECSLSVDVLASWRDEIGAQRLYVLRSSAEHDGAIQDNTYATTANIQKSIVNGDDIWGDTYSEGTLVIGVLSTGGNLYYAMNTSTFSTLLDYLFSDAYAEALVDNWINSFPELKAQTNPLQYISSVMFIPTAVQGGLQEIRVGWVRTGIAGNRIADLPITIEGTLSVPQHPQAAGRGKYLNLAPYGIYDMFVPGFGSFNLSGADIFVADGSSITYNIKLDPRTGHATMRIFNTSGEVISYLQSQIGVPYQISQVYNKGAGIGQALNIAGNLAGAGASLYAGNYMGAAQGISGFISAIGDTVASQIPSARTVGSNGSLDALQGNIMLTATFYGLIDEDLPHRGRPLCTRKVLNTIPGFIMCADADIKIAGTESENEQIRNMLEGGIIYV